MTKILETKDAALMAEVHAIQNDLGGATINGQPRIGCKKLPDGRMVPLDQMTPDDWASIGKPRDYSPKWVGTKETNAIFDTEDGQGTKRLELIEPFLEYVAECQAKPANERTATEQKIAVLALIRDKLPDDFTPPGLDV